MMNGKSTTPCVNLMFDIPTIAFVILKLCGVVNWSWAWVFSPLWIAGVIRLICAFIWSFIEAVNYGNEDDGEV